MATRTIGTKLVISGEAEFKKALRESTDELKKVKSELKLLSEQYKGSANTAEALRQKVNKLTEAKTAQEAVIQKLKDGLKNAREQQELYAKKTQEMEGKIEEATLRLREMENTAGDTEKQQKELTEAVKEYTKELGQYKDAHQAAEDSADEWQHKLNAAETNLNKLNTEIIKQNNYLREAEKSTDGCAKSIDEYGKTVRQISTESGKLKNKVGESSAAIDALAVTLLSSGIQGTLKEVADILIECSEAAAEFESAMKKIETIADTTAKPMESIKSEIVELSSELGVAVGEISEATYNAISAGVETAESVKFVDTATKLAIGGFTDTTVAVDILTTALNAYKMETEEVEKVSDYLITTQNLGKTTVAELATNMGRVIPVASAYNVEMDNLSTAYALLTANGVATAESTTYLKSILGELGDSGSTVSKTLKTHTGKTFAELMDQGKSLGDVLDILGESVNNDAGAFNELWSSSEAGIGALSLLGAGSEKYNSVLRQMQGSAGATEKAFGLMADTTKMAQQRMTVAIDNVKVAVGDSLNPVLEELYNAGGDAFAWAADFIGNHPEIVKAVAAIAAGLTVLTAGVVAVHGAMLLLNAVMAMNPTSLLIVAIAAGVTALGAFAASMVAVTDETQTAAGAAREFADQVENINNSAKESAEAYEDQRKEIHETVSSYREMADELKQLVKLNDKTEESELAILSLVEQLNEAVPELALAYDAETGSLNKTAEAIDAVIDAQEKLSEYDLARARQAELMEEQRQASDALEEATERLTQAQENLRLEMGIANTAMVGDNATAISTAEAALSEYTRSVQLAEEALKANENALADVNAELDAYTAASAELEPETRKVIDTLLEQAEALKVDEEAYQKFIAQVAEAAEEHAAHAEEIRESMQIIQAEMDVLQEEYNESYESARENIEGQIGLFQKLDGEATASIEELIASLQSQSDYMNTYAENLKKAMELGVDEGIVQKLSDGSEESAKYLAAIVTAGKEEIDALNAEFQRVEEGKNNFAVAIAEMETGFSAEMEEMSKAYYALVNDLDNYDRAYAAAVNTCEGIKRGLDDKQGEIALKYKGIAQVAFGEFNRTLEINSPSKKFEWSAKMTMEGVEKSVDQKTPDIENSYRDVAQAAYRSFEEQARNMESEAKMGEQNMVVASYVPSPVKVETVLRDEERSWNEMAKQLAEVQAERERIIYLTNQTVLDGKVIGESTTKHVIKNVTRKQANRNAAMGGMEIVYG